MEITDEMVEEAKRNNPNGDVHVENDQIIVSAIASMTGNAGWNGRNTVLRQAMERADVLAVESIMNDGIPLNNSEAILERKREYRARVKDAWNRIVEKQMKEQAEADAKKTNETSAVAEAGPEQA